MYWHILFFDSESVKMFPLFTKFYIPRLTQHLWYFLRSMFRCETSCCLTNVIKLKMYVKSWILYISYISCISLDCHLAHDLPVYLTLSSILLAESINPLTFLPLELLVPAPIPCDILSRGIWPSHALESIQLAMMLQGIPT